MRLRSLLLAFLLAGCGASGASSSFSIAGSATIAVGGQMYTLDQLAAAPNDGSNAHLLYAVIRVTTAESQHTVSSTSFTLVDAAGNRYNPVTPTVYVPIDTLDGLTISPGHPGAGVIAFPTPSAPPLTIAVEDGGQTGVLRAP